jgi:hypothetical protein
MHVTPTCAESRGSLTTLGLMYIVFPYISVRDCFQHLTHDLMVTRNSFTGSHSDFLGVHILTLNELVRIKRQHKTITSTTWTWSLAYVIEPNYYIFCLSWCFFAYTHVTFSPKFVYIFMWGVYNVTLDAVELFNTLAPSP